MIVRAEIQKKNDAADRIRAALNGGASRNKMIDFNESAMTIQAVALGREVRE